MKARPAKAVDSQALLQKQSSAMRFGAPGRQADPPGTPLTRRDCHKVQGLLSSHVFEPPLVVQPCSPPGVQHTHWGLPCRQAPTLQINS